MHFLAFARVFKKSINSKNVRNLQNCRLCSSEPSLKFKPKPKQTYWTINGANSAYTSVNATLHVPSTKVAFNCGEGLQRLIDEDSATRLTSIQHICITRMDWKCVAGLPGVLLSLNTRKAKQLNVFGPSTLNHLCNEIIKYMPKMGFDVSAVDCDNGNTCTEKNLRIHAIPLKNASERNAKVIAYVGCVNAYRSEIDIEKCVDLNVPAGPLIKQLSDGSDVTLDDGSIVRVTDVTEYFPKLNFLVIDIPTADYLPHLENSKLMLDDSETQNTVFYFAPPKIIAMNEYQNYLQKFPAGTLHMTTNERITFYGHISPHKHPITLNHINEQVFPLLKEKIDQTIESSERNENGVRIADLIANRTIVCRPENYIEDELRVQPSKRLENLREFPDKVKSIENFHKLYNEHIVGHSINERAKEYPKIVFLGTGATVPEKNRNVSAILVHVRFVDSIISLGQLFRFYGDQAHDILKNLKAIYVSHMHLDHYMGIFNLLRELKEMQSLDSNLQPISLMGPVALERRLELLDFAVQDVSGSYKFIQNDRLISQIRTPQKDAILATIGFADIQTCSVQHIPQSFGISLSVRQAHKDSIFKLTYSGDTTPCNDLVKMGKNSTVLIHEATLEDDLAESAEHKKHSTVSQAVMQGNEMKAKHIILTHFSQRYRLTRLQRALPHNVTCAFDNMELVESDLTLSHHLY